MSDLHPSAQRVLTDLRTRYPDASFLALGQTVWWDEPMKAVLRVMLDGLGLGGHMVLGVHDTDYFARVKTRLPGQGRYELLPHNDGATKDLWSAAGEVSRLFGSESYPTRHDFARHRVPFEQVVRCMGEDRQSFLNDVTEAWGWRGLVYTGSRDLIVHTLPLSDVGPAVDRMLQWGFDGTQESIVDNCCREEARALSERLLGWVRQYRAAHPEAMLSDLYQDVFPRLFELLLGAPPADVSVDCTAHLLLLNPQTASLPRFQFVDLFLNERTRALAARAYNEAVEATEIYTLDKFGLGALPFDLVLPQHGRGTLRVTLRAIHVETRHPIRIPLERPVTCIQDLAAVLTREFGDHVTLVGKAVALISMMAREFIFVFNEEGSGYVSRTRKMNDYLRRHGVDLPLHPILRLHYHTWDALAEGRARLALPQFLAGAFGAEQVSSADLGASWIAAVDGQSRLLDELQHLTRPRDLLRFLAARGGDGWTELLQGYEDAKARLCDLRQQGAAIQQQVDAAWQDLAATKQAIRDTERAKGDHFRSVTEWTSAEEERRAAFDRRIAELLSARRTTLDRIAELKTSRMAVERGPEATQARESIAEAQCRADAERLHLVRGAILATRGLPHTDHRPAAWWLPMVDPSGRWFRRIVELTEVYTEPVLSEA